jgi:hypothetical protein
MDCKRLEKRFPRTAVERVKGRLKLFSGAPTMAT